jgi:hypothetical protein
MRDSKMFALLVSLVLYLLAIALLDITYYVGKHNVRASLSETS